MDERTVPMETEAGHLCELCLEEIELHELIAFDLEDGAHVHAECAAEHGERTC